MSATPRQPVVLDATVLSNFASTGTVDVLVGILDRPATVPAVQTELGRGYARDYDFLDDALVRIGDDITLLGVEKQSTGRQQSGIGSTAVRRMHCSARWHARERLRPTNLAGREMATERAVPMRARSASSSSASGAANSTPTLQTSGWMTGERRADTTPRSSVSRKFLGRIAGGSPAGERESGVS